MLRHTALFLLAFTGMLAGNEESYQPLFVIERSSNANVVHYDAKVGPNGELDPREPVVVYWTMDARDGHRQELNYLEKTRAYGIVVEPGSIQHSYRIALVSEKRLGIRVYRDGGAVRAETIIEGHRAYLHKIYVDVRKRSLLGAPESIELTGTDVASGATLHQTIVPGHASIPSL